mgnify:FL=1
MSSILKTQFKKVIITPEQEIVFKKGGSDDGDKNSADALDITPAVVAFDYYEDLLSPSITVNLKISNTSGLYSLVPIRGYERIDLVIGTAYGDITFGDEDKNPLYVIGIEGLTQTEGQEIFTLKCSTLENLKNETSRCQVRYPRVPISTHVQTILEEVLQVDPDRIVEVEDTVTSYGFIGNNRKPFHTLTWLCPKAIPSTSGVKGTAGSEAKGTAGYVFYEDYKGFHFRSVDRLVDATQVEYPTDSDELKSLGVETYTYSSTISRNGSENEKQIISHYTDKTTNLQKNLRVGMYGNLTYFYNPLTWKADAYLFNLKEEIGENIKTAGDNVPIPQGDISKFASRVLVRIGDTGMWDPELTKVDDEVVDSGRDSTDMAKSFSRYSLLFQQSLNIVIPCNISLRVGRVIKIVFPSVGPEESGGRGSKEADTELSGFYLIRALRHHFELNEGTNTTSLNLIRDSYGIQ